MRLRLRGTLFWTASSADEALCEAVLGRLWARRESGEGRGRGDDSVLL